MSADTPADGVVVYQPDRGFRYGAEAFWLVGFALQGGLPRTAVDLGCGSGILALLLARQGVDVVGVDVRPEWGPLWAKTLVDSRVPGNVDLRTGDVADVNGVWDLAISNPPFFSRDAGPTSADPWKSAARTESTATLADFVAAGLRCAPRLCVVVPRDREGDVLRHGVAVRHVRVGARRTLLELRACGEPGEMEVVAEGDVRAKAWYREAAGPVGAAR